MKCDKCPEHAHTHIIRGETCEHHKIHPGANWAGCTCSIAYSYCENITCPEAQLKLKEGAARATEPRELL